MHAPTSCYTALKQTIEYLNLKEPSLNSINIIKHIILALFSLFTGGKICMLW